MDSSWGHHCYQINSSCSCSCPVCCFVMKIAGDCARFNLTFFFHACSGIYFFLFFSSSFLSLSPKDPLGHVFALVSSENFYLCKTYQILAKKSWTTYFLSCEREHDCKHDKSLPVTHYSNTYIAGTMQVLKKKFVLSNSVSDRETCLVYWEVQNESGGLTPAGCPRWVIMTTVA